MKNTIQILSILGAAALFTLPVSAGGPPHHNEGVGLATDIVRLVKTILARPSGISGSDTVRAVHSAGTAVGTGWR